MTKWKIGMGMMAGILAAGVGLAAEKPNVVVVMVDDLGWADLGCYGSEIETPVLDRLAGNGLRFTQFYNTAKCHSSRICLLSGQTMFQAGNETLSKAATFAEVLRQGGYHTMMVGKWHLNGNPIEHGFDRYFGHLSGATNFFTGDDTFRLNGAKWNDFDDDFYTTDAFVDFGLDFLKEARATRKPWLLYVAFNAPHYPLQAPEADVKKYEGRYDEGWDAVRKARNKKQRQVGVVAEDTVVNGRPGYVPAWEDLDADSRKWESRRMEVFAAMVDRVDQNMGRLVADLEAHGELDNTLILFCSDNGACPFDRTRRADLDPWDPKSYWCYDPGWAHVGNTPFRHYKQNQHEGGIRSPLIVHWPKGLKTKAGSVTDQTGHLIDVLPTVAEAAGATYPEKVGDRKVGPVQGRSLIPVFKGKQREPHPMLYFQFADNRAARSGDWKAVSFRGGPWELYNIAEDPTELHDLASTHPERVKDLAAQWFAYARDVEQAPAKLQKPVKDKPAKWPYKRKTWADQLKPSKKK